MPLPAALTVWTALLLARLAAHDPAAPADAALCALAELVLLLSSSFSSFCCGTRALDNPQSDPMALHAGALALLSAVTVALRRWSADRRDGGAIRRAESESCSHGPSERDADGGGGGGGEQGERRLPLLVFPARTTHARLAPRTHAFAYSYLLVGLPVTHAAALAGARVPLLAAVLGVDADDYLLRERERRGSTLRGKLDVYLHGVGVEPSEFPAAYLVTAPRVLGYSFNPASFWYLYGVGGRLDAMVVEVNNTFDERRMYFVRRDGAVDAGDREGAGADAARFTSTWAKDFHVSPFNSRKGIYAMIARDPLAVPPSSNAQGREHAVVSNTITLTSSDGQPKMTARIFSTGLPIDGREAGLIAVLKLLTCYGWVGFLTFPRIIREAWKLYFRRSLHVWYRPEVKRSSIGRTPTSTERDLESFFRRFLEHTVQNSPASIALDYIPAPGMGQDMPQRFTSNTAVKGPVKITEIQILSPAFYSRFVHFAHFSEALDKECFLTEEENRTVLISNAEQFMSIFNNKVSRDSPHLSTLRMGDRLRWKALRQLRCPPAPQSYTATAIVGDKSRGEDIRPFPMSSLDCYAIRHCNDGWLYRRRVCGLFVAERFFSGFDQLVGPIDKLLRFVIILTGLCLAPRLDSVQWFYVRDRGIPCSAAQVAILSIMHVWNQAKGWR